MKSSIALITLVVVAAVYVRDIEAIKQNALARCLEEANMKAAGTSKPALVMRVAQELDQFETYPDYSEISATVLGMLEESDLEQFVGECINFEQDVREILYGGSCGEDLGFINAIESMEGREMMNNYEDLSQMVELDTLCYLVTVSPQM